MVDVMYKSRKFAVCIVMAVVALMLLLPLLNRAVPLLSTSWSLVVSSFVRLWILIRRRPFIYIIVNFIIISLLASTSSISLHLNHLLLKFHSKTNSYHQLDDDTKLVVPTFVDDFWWCHIIDSEAAGEKVAYATSLVDATWKLSEGQNQAADYMVHSKVCAPPEVSGAHSLLLNEEYKVGTFCHVSRECVPPGAPYNLSEQSNPNAERKGEEGEEEDDTLDATWKAIMEAKKKGSPQLKKSDTWSNGTGGGGGGGGGKGGLAKYRVEMKKWRTFREPEVVVTDRDELKKRADAFIERFTEDMRLQRLESDQRFLEMINRGL